MVKGNMARVVMIRHGQSQWNLENRFTGWTDVDLTPLGVDEARTAGRLIKDTKAEFDVTFTSVLSRAIRTLWLMLEEMDRVWLPQTVAWQLNERHYGALQGLNKAEIGSKYGQEQLHIWRRSYDTAPPALDENDQRHPKFDFRYRNLSADELPATESLKNTLDRTLPYWQSRIAPLIDQGQSVIIAAHGNSLRALCKHLLGIGDQDISSLEIPTGNPLLFEIEKGLKVVDCQYLDGERATQLPSF